MQKWNLRNGYARRCRLWATNPTCGVGARVQFTLLGQGDDLAWGAPLAAWGKPAKSVKTAGVGAMATCATAAIALWRRNRNPIETTTRSRGTGAGLSGSGNDRGLPAHPAATAQGATRDDSGGGARLSGGKRMRRHQMAAISD